MHIYGFLNNSHSLRGMKGRFEFYENEDLIYHVIDTSIGQSGSAVYIEESG